MRQRSTPTSSEASSYTPLHRLFLLLATLLVGSLAWILLGHAESLSAEEKGSLSPAPTSAESPAVESPPEALAGEDE